LVGKQNTTRNFRFDVFDSNFKPFNLGPDAVVDRNIPQKFAPSDI